MDEKLEERLTSINERLDRLSLQDAILEGVFIQLYDELAQGNVIDAPRLVGLRLKNLAKEQRDPEARKAIEALVAKLSKRAPLGP